jgi:hypothetical protein
VYKIISRAINNRLNKVVNRICSRSQKGFNDKRFTQECLINVIETISHCNNNGISGAVVAVDMAKAFDTLSHAFLRDVFRFFGFGPQITKWLELLGQNRMACITLDDGTYSRNFCLGRGRAQGDNISPNTFNFGEQILLFKIELDPVISGVWGHVPRPINLPNVTNPFFMYESGRETSKNESMADDNTTIIKFEMNNLRHLRSILEGFSEVSGLTCNFTKTTVMPIGPEPIVPIDTAGFPISKSIKLLGLEINSSLTSLENSFAPILEKIEKIIHFWERFRLTLPGRLAIMKTLLIPQLNYLGCFLEPNVEILRRIQFAVDKFVIKNLNISMERRYLPPERGALAYSN